MIGTFVNKFWYVNDTVVNDLHITDDSDEDTDKAATVGKDNFFKRKQEVRTPESEFEKVTSKKDNKKKKSRNKSN